MEQAIAAYSAALLVLTPTTFPLECLGTGRNLGETAFTAGRWREAIAGYAAAIDAVEESRTQAMTESRHQEILEESIDIFEKMVQACINNGHKKATVANYRQLAKQVQAILSTHHAQSRLDNPLQSELLLGDGSITLGELLSPGWRLQQLVDVFLSCCETGLGLTETLTDDILTISFGFLCAGARSVVSTLWAVDDLATSLFSLFYHRYKQELSRPAALRKAQEELRTLTGDTLATQYKPLLTALLDKHLQQAIEAKKQAYAALKRAKKPSQDSVESWQKEYNQVDKNQE